MRLLAGNAPEGAPLGEGGQAFLCRSSGYETIAALEAALAETYEDAAARIDRVLGTEAEEEAAE